MLRPVIFIGCGGSGQKAVRYVRDSVARHLEHRNWEGEFPSAWQFIGIDTLTTMEDDSIPYLPNNDYVSVSLAYDTYQGLSESVDAKFGPEIKPKAFRDLRGWRPRPDQVTVPLQEGAGKLRAVGRMAGVLALQGSVRKRIEYAFTQCAAGGPQLAEVSRHLGVEVPPGSTVPAPLTIIVGSMAGGTGAGIMLDVVDLVRRTHEDGAFPVLVAFTPDIFGGVADHLMAANSAAFMSEMMSAYWDDENTDSELIPANVAVHTRGPHSVFLIGRKSIDGLDLLNSKNVYRAVGEALAAVTTSSAVQTEFQNFITTNWATAKRSNSGGYGFGDSMLEGVASSFGSATVSIGRDRFRDYLRSLLHRTIVEHLVDGYEEVAYSLLGESASRTMAAPAKINELSRRNIANFLRTCGLQEEEGSRMISDAFVSKDRLRGRLAEISNNIKRELPSTQQTAGAWLDQINVRYKSEIGGVKHATETELGLAIRDWGSSLYERMLRAVTEYSATLSMPVVLSLLELTRAQVLEASNVLKDEAKKNRNQSQQAEESSRKHLSGAGKGNLAITSSAVQQTIEDVAKAVVLDWAADTRDRLSVALESVTTGMLAGIEASIRQALSRLSSLTVQQDGNAAVIGGWPKNDGVVPTNYAPSPVEFFLEDHSTWPEKAKKLVGMSLGDRASLPIDPIEAARILIIRGGFGGDGKSDSEIRPLIWCDSDTGRPVWEPGQQVAVKISDQIESMSERIGSWMMRPATELRNTLKEGLSTYLMPTRDGAAVADHLPRMAMFRQQLKSALKMSLPLIQIDTIMNSTVHPNELSYKLNIQGFPFGDGHPARKETEQIIQGFLKTAEPVNDAFASGDAESVLITNFLEYPVNPSVVTSFTQPLAAAVNSFSPALLRTSFWQWRRARILENFVPLPDPLRVAAIRGFAVARILGTVSANPGEGEQNSISTSSGVHYFPKNLLTETDKSNILPSLLEAMVLTFADAPTKQRRAFLAYAALVEYGTGGGMASGFEVAGEFERILRTGDHGPLAIIDSDRAADLIVDGQSIANRIENARAYIKRNLNHFDELSGRELDPRSWRDKLGYVEPVDTLTLELISDMRKAYSQVDAALTRFEQRLTSGGGAGPV